MSLQRTPLILSVAILTMVGAVLGMFVHAQSGTKAFTGKAALQPEDVGGSIESDMPITRKTIRLENTGSGSDVFRTSLAPNPEGRCGLRLAGEPAPSSNTLPNPYPTTRDTSIAVGPGNAVYLTVACVTGGLSPGSFTWGFKTVSLGAVEANVPSVIAEAQDTVQVTAPIPCTDSDGMNYSTKGIATGTYGGARPGYIAIYGQEPDPLTPKATTEKFSTFIDHCSWDPRYLNEGFCDGLGKLSAMGAQCPNGCKDGVCVALSSSSSASSLLSSSSTISSTAIPATGMDAYNTCLWRVCPPPGPTTSACIDTCVRETSGPAQRAALTGSGDAVLSTVVPPSVTTPGRASTTPSLPTKVPSIPPTAQPTTHQAPSPTLPRAQTGSITVEKKVSKARVQALKKQQQALRRELRTLERSLLRKKNHAALSQIVDLRDELADLDLRDPSIADNLRSIQEEIADLRQIVSKKRK